MYRILYMPFSTTDIELRCSKYRLCMMINRLVKGQKALGHVWGASVDSAPAWSSYSDEGSHVLWRGDTNIEW